MFDGRTVTAVIDGSFDGLLTVVFARYYDKLTPDEIVVRDVYQQRLDAEYIMIRSDAEKAKRVFDALLKTAPEAAENVFYAFSSPSESRYINIFKYILLAFSKKNSVDRYLKLDYVRSVLQMRSYAGKETHKLHGFVRFAQTRAGVLYSEIAPVNDVLYFVALHFTERLISEAWIIHDVTRKKAAIYDAKELVLVDTGGYSNVDLAHGEEQFQALFIEFLASIAIKDRTNPKLQRQLLPNRYRPYMAEFTRMPTDSPFHLMPNAKDITSPTSEISEVISPLR